MESINSKQYDKFKCRDMQLFYYVTNRVFPNNLCNNFLVWGKVKECFTPIRGIVEEDLHAGVL